MLFRQARLWHNSLTEKTKETEFIMGTVLNVYITLLKPSP